MTESEDATLTSLGIRHGDVIVIQEGQGSSMTSAKTNTQAPSLDSNRQALTSTPPVSAATSNTTASPSQPQSSKEEPLQGSSTAGDGAPGRNSRPQQPLLPTERGATASGAKLGIGSTEDAHVRVDGGWVVLRVVPDDNSCLFTALSICLEHGRTNAIQKLRQSRYITPMAVL